MTLRVAAVVPPTTSPRVASSMPSLPLATATVPVLSVPMRLPWMVLLPIGAGVDAVGDAVAAVAGDDVAVAGRGAADGVVGAAQEDAVELVADGLEAAGVGADVVALDRDADGRVLEEDARPGCRR